MSSIGEVVRGNVSSLFGRFRPPAGKSEEEIKAAKAERIEFGDRLIPMLKLLSAEGSKVDRACRAVFRELQSEPTSNPMPTPDTIAARVREKLNVSEHRPDCPGCKQFGGVPGIFSDTAPGTDVLRGSIAVERGWLCLTHHEPLAWYLNRQARYDDGLTWPYPPPTCLIPREAHVPGADPDHYYEYTDGALISPLGYWVREYAEGLLGNTLLDDRRPRV